MRLPRSRFTVRRLMVAVAVIALLIAAGQAGDRWLTYRGRADRHQQAEAGARQRAAEIDKMADFIDDLVRRKDQSTMAKGAWGMDTDALRREADRYRLRAARDGELGRKYRRAMGRPWLAVPPDPAGSE